MVGYCIIILFLLSFYFILTRIFGNSASDLTIIVALFSFLGSLMLKVVSFIYGLNREVGEVKVNSINSFGKIKNDMGLLKESIQLLRGDVSKIRKKLRV